MARREGDTPFQATPPWDIFSSQASPPKSCLATITHQWMSNTPHHEPISSSKLLLGAHEGFWTNLDINHSTLTIGKSVILWKPKMLKQICFVIQLNIIQLNHFLEEGAGVYDLLFMAVMFFSSDVWVLTFMKWFLIL